MTDYTLRIGSRKSELALKQTYIIERLLKEAYPDLKTKIITSDTLGDKNLTSPLQSFGGKGVFVSELEEALLSGQIDLAVHSAKAVSYTHLSAQTGNKVYFKPENMQYTGAYKVRGAY